MTFGPFPDPATADALIARVRADGGIAQRVEDGAATVTRYVVYTGPYPDWGAAREALARVKSDEIDAVIIPSGELERAVSAGVFSTRGNARRQSDRIDALGLHAQISEIDQAATRYRVVADRRPAGAAAGTPCQDVASVARNL